MMIKGQGEKSPVVLTAVFVSEHTMKMLADQVACLPKEDRSEKKIVLVGSGTYPANANQVVLFNHKSSAGCLKANLLQVATYNVWQIRHDQRIEMGVPHPHDERALLKHLKECWDRELELCSIVELLVCCNLRGRLIDERNDLIRFHQTLSGQSRE